MLRICKLFDFHELLTAKAWNYLIIHFLIFNSFLLRHRRCVVSSRDFILKRATGSAARGWSDSPPARRGAESWRAEWIGVVWRTVVSLSHGWPEESCGAGGTYDLRRYITAPYSHTWRRKSTFITSAKLTSLRTFSPLVAQISPVLVSIKENFRCCYWR